MREADKRMYYIVSPNSFAYNPARINVGSIGYQNIGKNVIVSSLYEVFKTSEDVDDRLLWHWFKSPDFQKLIMQLQEGGVRLYFYYDKLCMGEVSLPSLEEQRKIGKLFNTLDNLITLHQRECISFTARAGRRILTANKKRNTSSWEQRKLGELGTITTGNTPSTSIPDYYSDDGIVWVTPTDICENITFESARKLSDLGQQAGRVVPKNTILVTCIASIGKNTMLGNTGSFNQQINGLTPNENKYDPYFLLTESALWSAKMKGSAAAGTMQIVNRTEFSELKTWLPSLIEQQAIGAFFKQLDHLITLHQRQSFSHSTPDISLSVQLIHPFYTSSWEQRKLGDIADIVGGGTPSTGNQSYWDGDIDWYAPAEIADQIYANSSQKKITGLGYENSSAKMLPPGTVLFTSRAGIGKTAILTRKGCTNQGFQSIVPHRGELDSYFIFSRTEELKRYGELVGAGSTFVEVSGKQMAVMELMMPPTMREQQTIGGFFQQLDHLITLHQRKGKAAVSGCSNDANNSKGVCCKPRDFGYKCHKKDESK